jgi:hypothetical protein
MIYFKKILLSGLFLAMAVSTLLAQESLDDPYVILNRHFDAVGGLDRLKAERSHYLEGNVSVAGLQGTLKVWIWIWVFSRCFRGTTASTIG